MLVRNDGVPRLAMWGAALATAISPILGLMILGTHFIRKMKRVYESVRLAIYWALGLGILFYAIGMMFPEFLVSIFTKENSELMATTVRGIRIYFVSFLLMGLNIVMTTYIQSKEYAKVSAIISLTRGFG